MKITMVGNFWYPEFGGGLEHYFHGLLDQLSKRHGQVSFYTLGNPPTNFQDSRGYSIGTKNSPLPTRMISAYKMYRKTLSRDSEIINVHFALNALPLLPLLPLKAPMIFHFQGPWAYESAAEGTSSISIRLKKTIEKLVFQRCAHFITASTSFADILSNDYGVPREKISTIPLAIDLESFYPITRSIARNKLHWKQDIFTIFTARRLVQRVGIKELIEAAALISPAHRIRICIAGRGPLQSAFEQQIRQLNLGDRVELLGYLSDEQLRLAYSASDLVILPTQQLEGFGLTFAEALACGTPVIVTPVGGMPEYVAPLDPQLIINGKTPEAISARIEMIVSQNQRLPSREQCRTYAQEHFSWDKNIARVCEVFQRTINESA